MTKPSSPLHRLLCISILLLIAGGILYLLARLELPVPCLFYRITGLRCPGCGNTRAVMALLEWNLPTMLRYNLFFPVEIAYLIWVYCHCAARCLKTGRFSYRSPVPALDWCFLTSILLWGILRNVLHI